MWIASAERLQTIDRLAVADYGLTDLALAEEAAQAAADRIESLFTRGPNSLAVFYCGKGNNGLDGYLTARKLAERMYGAVCLFWTSRENLSPELRQMIELDFRVSVVCYGEEHWEMAKADTQYDIYVDALLGVGSRGAPEGAMLEAVRVLNAHNKPVFALDLPTGVDPDTGIAEGEHVTARWTTTFGLPKPGLFQNDGQDLAGDWTVAPLSYPAALVDEPTGKWLTQESEIRAILPRPKRRDHKNSRGRLLLIAGSNRYPGAPLVTTRAALRTGAGTVTVASVQRVCSTVNQTLPEALTLPLPGDSVGPDSLENLIALQDSFDACVIGPGLSTSEHIQEFLSAFLLAWTKPLCLDADALTVVSSMADDLPDTSSWVLTPHPGEAGRLLGSDAKTVSADRFGAAQQLQQKYAATAVLKGAWSIVAAPDEPLRVNPTGNPGMASAGQGDCLAGVIGTLLAQGLSPSHAAVAGTYLHGLAGDLAAESLGPVGFTASDTADALPKALAKLAMW